MKKKNKSIYQHFRERVLLNILPIDEFINCLAIVLLFTSLHLFGLLMSLVILVLSNFTSKLSWLALMMAIVLYLVR